ncbi:MAG: hypothetical protein U1G08_05450 [Verrucomicrobiota bacterium]
MKPTPSSPPVPLHEDSTFRVLVMLASAVGMGGVVASLTTLKQGQYGFEFHWTNLAIPGFFAGAIIACIYWLMIFRFSARSASGGGRRPIVIASFALLGASIVAFLYPVRFIPEQKRGDVIIGLSAAIVVLSGIGYLIHTIVRWLDQDGEENSGTDPDDLN